MIYDISRPLDESFAVFPGDVAFSRDWTMRLENGDSCNVSCFHGSAHAGTHVDLPLHFADDDFVPELDTFLGRAVVIEILDWAQLKDLQVEPGLRILFKTRNSETPSSVFDDGFFCLDAGAVAWLVESRATLVGVDAPSLDSPSSNTLDNHHALRRADIAILENLDLSSVLPGWYELIALPLRIPGADATWVRAVLRDIP